MAQGLEEVPQVPSNGSVGRRDEGGDGGSWRSTVRALGFSQGEAARAPSAYKKTKAIAKLAFRDWGKRTNHFAHQSPKKLPCGMPHYLRKRKNFSTFIIYIYIYGTLANPFMRSYCFVIFLKAETSFYSSLSVYLPIPNAFDSS